MFLTQSFGCWVSRVQKCSVGRQWKTSSFRVRPHEAQWASQRLRWFLITPTTRFPLIFPRLRLRGVCTDRGSRNISSTELRRALWTFRTFCMTLALERIRIPSSPRASLIPSYQAARNSVENSLKKQRIFQNIGAEKREQSARLEPWMKILRAPRWLPVRYTVN